jgi:hypothetical protein
VSLHAVANERTVKSGCRAPATAANMKLPPSRGYLQQQHDDDPVKRTATDCRARAHVSKNLMTLFA